MLRRTAVAVSGSQRSDAKGSEGRGSSNGQKGETSCAVDHAQKWCLEAKWPAAAHYLQRPGFGSYG